MDYTALATAFVSLLVIIDPIGLAPMFVALTQGADAAHRRAVAIRACLIAFVLLTLFGLFGEAVLGFAGITMPAFRIAGGALLFLTAIDMLFERRTKRRKGQAAAPEVQDDPSVFPLATPLIAGPGAITTMILLADKAPTTTALILTLAVMAAVIALVFLLFLGSGLMEHALGETGINVITRILGMLLAALSVQFMLDGLSGAGLMARAAGG